MFDLDQFIADLRATLPEKSRQPMKEVVARAVSDPAALMRAIGAPDKAGVARVPASAIKDSMACATSDEKSL